MTPADRLALQDDLHAIAATLRGVAASSGIAAFPKTGEQRKKLQPARAWPDACPSARQSSRAGFTLLESSHD